MTMNTVLESTVSRIRLNPYASILPTPAGVLLRSDRGMFQVTGEDLTAFLERMVPLLDGTRDRAAVLAALPGYAPASVTAFLDTLAERGLVDEAPEVEAPSSERRAQHRYLSLWSGAPEDAPARLAGARVVMAGLSPWGATAAIELSAAGIGALQLTGGEAAPLEALAEQIREVAPNCRVSAAPQASLDEASLVVAALPLASAAQIEHVARLAHRAGVRSLWSHLSGETAVLGPLVVPSRTACRLCAAAVAVNPPPAAVAREQKTTAMEQILGHLVALEVIKVISGYTLSKLWGRLLAVDPVSLETTVHTLVRLPWCQVCGR